MKFLLRRSAAFGLLCACGAIIGLSGCSSCVSETLADHAGHAEVAESEASEGIADRLEQELETIQDGIDAFFDEREFSTPVHARIGETVQATDHLSVCVLSVETGPYDFFDKTPTVKVEVRMDNLSDEVVIAKASNWDADNTDGERVDHKLWIEDADDTISDGSFELTRISPRASFVGTLYFDGTGLVDVVYEPHWLISSQNQYIYFEAAQEKVE